MKCSSVGRFVFAAAIAAALATIPLTAGGQEEKPAAQKKAAGGSHSMTGCLQKGDEAAVPYKLTNVEGTGPKEVEIVGMSKGVDLAPHVSHKMTITGTTVPTKAAAKAEGTKDTKKDAAEYHMRITAIKMVSPTCP
jgi:trans-2-enoyl-CoA reductase